MTDFWRMMTFISSGGGRQGPGARAPARKFLPASSSIK